MKDGFDRCPDRQFAVRRICTEQAVLAGWIGPAAVLPSGMRFLRKLGRNSRAPAARVERFDAALAPEETFAAIGDVHGRFDLLGELVMRLCEAKPVPRLVFVGDYVDRGEQSRSCLQFLMKLEKELSPRPVFLAGNHEHMTLSFLKDPEKYGDRWFRYGGLQTLASFGVGLDTGDKGAALRRARDDLAKAMGDDMVAWLRGLVEHWRSGNVAVVHAGASPYAPVETQSRRTLLWGHSDFNNVPRGDGVWVVHGHTIVDEPVAANGRISVDTGAYATGRLTAARISNEGVAFLST